ncbi:unnamed protein product, partial [Mesorhabditis spiculigera]
MQILAHEAMTVGVGSVKSSSACSLQSSDSGEEIVIQTEEDVLAKAIKVRNVFLIGALLPGVGCYFCVAWTYIFQFQENIMEFQSIGNCNGTHSYIPPISYTIGVWSPQRYIWMFIVIAHFPARFLFVVLYRRVFLGNSPRHFSYRWVLNCFMVTMILEPVGLVSVTVLDINLFVLHCVSYAVWLIPFNFNMLFSVLLHHFSRVRKSNAMHERTWRLKLILFITGMIVSLSTAVTYPYFMATCNEYAYYAFSMAEYSLVTYNSMFYFLAYFEFPEMKITFGVKELHTVQRIKVHPQRIIEERQFRKNQKLLVLADKLDKF